MKVASKVFLLGALLLLAASTAYAAAPVVVAIPDMSINAGASTTLNVVAYDVDGDNITLTSSLPAWATLNAPTTGTGLVVTTITLNPTASDLGTVSGSVTATANGEATTEPFQLTVNASGTNLAPIVTAPANQTVNEGSNLTFTVTASDAEAITALAAAPLPAGATFTANASYTSGTFSWTPTSSQSGDYNVVFTASNALSGSATTHIHVVDVTGVNTNPDVTAPATQSVNEGQMVTFTVTATDANGDHVTLTASNVPSGATFTDNGNNTGTFTWTPGSTQSGSYTVTFTGNDGHGGTDAASTVITVNDVTGGGGGGTEATAKLLGAFNSHRKFLCFRIDPVNNGFDVRNVDLTTIRFSFGGTTIDAMTGKTSLDWSCESDSESDGEDRDAAALLHKDGGWDGDGDCGECDHEDCPSDTTGCTVSLRACFAMSDLRGLFGDQSIPDNLASATITGSLSTGGTFTATLGAPKVAGNGGDNGKGHEKHALHAKATPNPLNPQTKLTFTLSQAGRVRVLVYDARGRYVKTLLDENRYAGAQTLTWDGSDAHSRKVSSGMYLFRIVAPEGQDIQRVTVLK
ncbi:MAG TPA: putative Ig domain-containing protein [Candidatus Binatia bacterium]|nr:putative Ig domain-containing protein [Candidatus Binatia bacterium]